MSFIGKINRKLDCKYKNQCSGCSWITKDPDEQQKLKTEALTRGLLALKCEVPGISYIRPLEQNFRDRLDFVYEKGSYGLYSHEKQTTLDLDVCPVLSPSLSSLYQEFRQISFPISKGSFRLRVSPHGARGIWLDFSNLDIKNLFEEKTSLQRLLQLGFVEIGQKSKRLIMNEAGNFKLAEPELQIWFKTYSDTESFDLYSYVSSFTQPGHQLNHELILQIQDMFKKQKFIRAAEFGAGIGNLTLPFLEFAESIHAYDWDQQALDAIKKSLSDYPEFLSRIKFHWGDYRKKPLGQGEKIDLLVLNPARSGLGSFLQELKQIQPKEIFYMSCYLESFLVDVQKFLEEGYKLIDLRIFDQFPHTPHFEILSRWTR